MGKDRVGVGVLEGAFCDFALGMRFSDLSAA